MIARNAGLLLGGLLAAGCSSPTYQEAFDRGDLDTAVSLVDEDLDGDGKVEDNEPLYVMDKAMITLAQGEPLQAVELMGPIRQTLDDRYVDGLLEWLDPSPARIANPSGLGDFVGADYEQLLVYAMLAMSEFIGNGTDADVTPYTFALEEKQKRMLEPDEELGEHDPRQDYKQIALGQYLQGIMHEARLDWDAALKSFETAAAMEPDSELLKRAATGERAPEGHGAIYVIYMGGAGPKRESGPIDPAAEIGVRGLLALIQAATTNVAVRNIAIDQALQARVPVPQLAVQSSSVSPLQIRCGDVNARAELLLDVNDVAQQQLDANRAMRIAQTVVLRAARQAAGHQVDNSWWRRLFNIGTSLAETADTRSWETLPAQFQAARVELPEGTQTLELGPKLKTDVVVRAGNTGLVLVWDRPDWDEGMVMVDKRSRPAGG